MIIPARARFVFAVVLLLLWIQVQAVQAQTPAQPKEQNAAIKYLRADVTLRQSYPLAPDAWVKLAQAPEQPISPEDEKLVAAASEALAEFQHGANLPFCDWQMSIEDGPFANTSHRGAISELAAVAVLRARLRFRDGGHAGAIADLLAAYAAARHLSLDGSIASVLFGYKIEREVTAVLQKNIAALAPAELDTLASGFAGLPQGSSMSSAIAAEKLQRNDLVEIIGTARTRDDLVSRMAAGIPVLSHDPNKARELVDACGGSVAGMMECIEKQQAFYRKWIGNFGLPPDVFQQQYDPDFARASTGNPVLKEFTPSLSRFRWAEAYNDVRRALVQAAIAVQRRGEKELSRYRDPSNGQPFSYTRLEDGFQLESSLKENGKPLSISVVKALRK